MSLKACRVVPGLIGSPAMANYWSFVVSHIKEHMKARSCSKGR